MRNCIFMCLVWLLVCVNNNQQFCLSFCFDILQNCKNQVLRFLVFGLQTCCEIPEMWYFILGNEKWRLCFIKSWVRFWQPSRVLPLGFNWFVVVSHTPFCFWNLTHPVWYETSLTLYVLFLKLLLIFFWYSRCCEIAEDIICWTWK